MRKLKTVDIIMLLVHGSPGIIYSARAQNLPRKEHFLPPDSYTDVCISVDKNC